MAEVTKTQAERPMDRGLPWAVWIAGVFVAVVFVIGGALVLYGNLDTSDRQNNLGVGLLTGAVTGTAVLAVEVALNKQRLATERADEEKKRNDLVEYATRELARLVPRYARELEGVVYGILRHAENVAQEVPDPPRFLADVRTMWQSVMSVSDIDQTMPDWYRDPMTLQRVDVTLLVATHLIEFTDEHVEASFETIGLATDPTDPANEPFEPTKTTETTETTGEHTDEHTDEFAEEPDEESAEPSASQADNTGHERLQFPVIDAASRISRTADILSQFRAPDRAQWLAHVASNITLAAETLDVEYALGRLGVPPLPDCVHPHVTPRINIGRTVPRFEREFLAYTVDLLRRGIAQERTVTAGPLVGGRPSDDEIARQRWPSLILNHDTVDGLWLERYAEGSWLRRTLEHGASEALRSLGIDLIPPTIERSVRVSQ